MSSPRRPSGARAKCPDQPSSKAQAKGSGKSQEQRGPYNSDRNNKPADSPADTRNGSAPTRRSGSGQRKKQTDTSESKDNDKAAPRQANSNQQSKTDRKREDESSQTDDQRTTEEKFRRARKSAPINSVNEAQKSAKSDTQCKQKIDTSMCESQDQSATVKSDKKPTSRRENGNRQSRKQKDTDGVREDASPPVELPDSTSQEKRRPKLTKKQSSNNTDHQGSVNDLDKVLQETIEKLKIKKSERCKASSCVNKITEVVISHLKRNMSWCIDTECLPTGSYYENVKICEPDEFDVMLTVPVKRVDIQPLKDNGAFYSIALKRHPNTHPLEKFLNEDKTIQASEMLKEFRDCVKEAVESLKCKPDFIHEIKVQRKKQKCPAVTLEVTENGNAISIDFVIGLKVHGSWPIYTKDGFKIEKWLGTKEKTDLKRDPYYLVPKYEGKGNVEHSGVVAKDAWRISFSHIEKHILKRHGHSKTCCEAQGKKCCRKECLKLLKYLLSQLKKKHPDKMSKFCSYHAKTTLLHACATKVEDSEWAYSQLADCFQQLLDDFVRGLKNQDLCNFFVPSQNLFHHDYLPKNNCEFLAKQILIQRNNNFPIFQ